MDDALLARLESEMPAPFRELFGERPVLFTIDCMHWELQNPTDEYARKETFSQYWGCSAGKVAICLANLGGALPPSHVHPGKITDPQITEEWLQRILGDAPNGDFTLDELENELKLLLAGKFGPGTLIRVGAAEGALTFTESQVATDTSAA